MTTRCVHLELCLTVDTVAFLRAWRRFVASRGIHPEYVFADGGSGFRIGDPVREWVESWDVELVERGLAELGTKFQWKTNTPTASHMNGVAESLIRSVRKGLDAAVVAYKRTSLAFDEWDTVLKEVCYLINSRPLFPDGDPNEFNCITVNTILHPYGQPAITQTPEEDQVDLCNMLKVFEGKVGVFWTVWQRHIPPQLLPRNKWFHTRSNLEIGDFVINLQPGLKGATLPRGQWPKAIVHEIHPSSDGLVRSATIRTSDKKYLKRPINKLCLIATREELENGLK